MAEFSALLVGLGQIGAGYDRDLDATQYVRTHARAMAVHPRFRLVGGVDQDATRRANFEQSYHTAAYESVEQVPGFVAPDVAIVATPTASHADIVAGVLARFRPRAILCEKPLAPTAAEARRIARTCASRGTALFVNYMRRADPAVLEVKRRIDAGEIVGPFKGVAWYSKGFLHNGSHFVDLLTQWLGDIQDMHVIDPGRPCPQGDGEPDVRVSFARGVVTFLAAWEETYSHYTIELLARNGRLRYDRGGEDVRWECAAPHPRWSGHSVVGHDTEVVPSAMARYQWFVAEQLAAALDGHPSQLCTGAEAAVLVDRMTSLLETP